MPGAFTYEVVSEPGNSAAFASATNMVGARMAVPGSGPNCFALPGLRVFSRGGIR